MGVAPRNWHSRVDEPVRQVLVVQRLPHFFDQLIRGICDRAVRRPRCVAGLFDLVALAFKQLAQIPCLRLLSSYGLV
jgi:hypothetical protein